MNPNEYIKSRRKELNLTQEQLAEKVGVDRVSVSGWEKGKGISPKNLKKLAEVLNVTERSLLFGEDDSKIDENTMKLLDTMVEVINLVEDRGTFTFEMAAKAFALALIALFVAFGCYSRLYSGFVSACFAVFSFVFLILGGFTWFIGEKKAEEFLQKRLQRKYEYQKDSEAKGGTENEHE